VRVVVSDPELLPDLVEFLREQVDAVVTVRCESELEVSLLGSYAREAMRMQLELRLRLWEVTRGRVRADIAD
jgi:hypothetical protein